MKNVTHKATFAKLLLAFVVVMLSFATSFSQTSWKGTTNTDWFTAANWTAGVPTASVDAIIGDRSITNYPVINASVANCKSVTIGGAFTGQLTMNANLNVAANVTINSNGTLSQPASTLNVTGNWSSAGNYNATASSFVVFNGTNQTIGGSNARFKNLTINTGSYVTLMANVIIDNTTVVNGTWDTNETPASYKLSGTTSLKVGATGTIRIKSADAPSTFQFTGGPTLVAGCTIDYASSTVTQTIYSNFAYDNLKISGSGLKQLSGDYASWQTAAADVGNVYVASGTLDLFSFSLSRGATGGTLTVANGASLRIGGTNSLPTFLNYSFATTSTVEYYGTTQVITPSNYGNLTLTGTATASFSIPSGKTISCGNNFLISGGTFNVSNSAGTSTLTATGSYTQTGGTVNVSSSTGTGVVNINTDMNISGGSFNVIANASAPNTTVTINGDLNISGTSKFNLETISSASVATINVNGNFNSSGTSVADVNGAGGVIDFGISGIANNAINVSGNFTKSGIGTFGSTSTTAAKGFVFNGTGTQIFNYSGAASAGVQYTVNAGSTVQMASGLALPAGTTPAASFTVNGTLDFGTNVITSTTNPTFLLASTGKLITANTGGINGSIAGTWATKTFSTGAQYEFNSAVANQSFGFTGLTITTPSAILVSNTGGIVSADVNVVFGNNATLTVNTNSILNAVGYTFAFGAGGKVFENGKMQTANSNGYAAANNTTIINTGNPQINLGATSTIEYNGTSAQNISAINYVNLTSSSTGARTLANSGTIGISGVFLAGTNTYTNTGSTVMFNGTVNQNIPAGFVFNNLTINNPAGVTLSGNATVGGGNNALNFTNGKITTGTYKLILDVNATSTGASSTEYVLGNLEKNFTKNTPSFTYDVGGPNYYSPVAILFAKVNGSGGGIMVNTTETSHPNLSTSGIPASSNIPVYWTVTNTGSVNFSNYALTLNWDASLDFSGLSAAALKIMQYASSAWTSPTLGGGTNNTKITASSLTTFGDYIVGNPCPTYIAGFSYSSGSFCTSGGTATATLNAGGTAGKFTATPNGLTLDQNTGNITLSSSKAGTYTVTNTVGTGACTTTATSTVTITAAPTATISYDQSPFCNNLGGNGIAKVHLTGTNGGTYTTTSGLLLTSTTGDIDVNNSTPGSYSVLYTIPASGACAQLNATASVVINDLGTWTGAADNQWKNGANWQCNKVPNNQVNVTIPGGLLNYPIITDVEAVNNITVQLGASLTITNGTLQIAGTDTSLGGKINAISGSVEFNGTTAQRISSHLFSSNVIQNLLITNPQSVTLDSNIRITKTVGFGNLPNKSKSTLYSNGYLTLVSTSSNSANVLDITNSGHNNGNAIIGNVTVERYIQGKRAYRFLTAPVNSTTSIKANWMEGVNNTAVGVNINPTPNYGTQITGAGGSANGFDPTSTNNPSLFTFNTAAQSWTAAPNTNGTFSAGTGLRIMVRGNRTVNLTDNNAASSATTLRATGTLVTGPVVFAAQAGAGTPGMPLLNNTIGGYSFIANPYASSVDWQSLYKTATGISPSYHIFDPTIQGSNNRGGYVSYNGALKVSDILKSLADSGIQSGQAFFIQTTLPFPTITFQESYKNNEFLPVFRTAADNAHINIALLLPGQDTTNSSADGTAVYFSDDYSNSVGNEDSYKMSNPDENIAIGRNGAYLSIEGRKTISGSDSIPLRMWQLSQKSYKMKISLTNMADNVESYLVDKYLNTTVPVANGDNLVPFTITSDAASSAIDRFSIVFESLATLPVRITGVKAYEKNNGVQVEWTALSESNIDIYEVEKSADAQNFAIMGSTKAKNNPGVAANYTAFDAKPLAGDNYYRIRTIEKSGAEQVSEIVKVNIASGKSGISVINNPVHGGAIQVLFDNVAKGNYMVNLINTAGERVFNSTINYTGGTVYKTLDVNSYLAPGVYHLQFTNGSASKIVEVLVQ